jgi:hypothetical protein
MYGSKTWSVILREEQRLKVSENRVLRRTFEPRREKVMGDWRKCIMNSFIPYTLL